MPHLLYEEPMPFDRVRGTYRAVEGDVGHVPGTEFDEIISLAPPPTPEELAAIAEHDAAAKARIEERAALRQSGGAQWMVKDGRVILGQEEP